MVLDLFEETPKRSCKRATMDVTVAGIPLTGSPFTVRTRSRMTKEVTEGLGDRNVQVQVLRATDEFLYALVGNEIRKMDHSLNPIRTYSVSVLLDDVVWFYSERTMSFDVGYESIFYSGTNGMIVQIAEDTGWSVAHWKIGDASYVGAIRVGHQRRFVFVMFPENKSTIRVMDLNGNIVANIPLQRYVMLQDFGEFPDANMGRSYVMDLDGSNRREF